MIYHHTDDTFQISLVNTKHNRERNYDLDESMKRLNFIVSFVHCDNSMQNQSSDMCFPLFQVDILSRIKANLNSGFGEFSLFREVCVSVLDGF